MKKSKQPKCLEEFFNIFEDGEENVEKKRINIYPFNNNSKIPISFNRSKGRYGIPKELRNEDGTFNENKLTKQEIEILNDNKIFKNKNGKITKKSPFKIIPKYYLRNQLDFDKFQDNNNLSFTIGFGEEETNLHLCVLDIDGIKIYPKDENDNTLKEKMVNGKKYPYQYDLQKHKESCEEIYKVLSDWDEETIDETTWSDGKHLYFVSSESLQTKEFGDDYFLILRYIHFPKDFPIVELQGKPINDEDGDRLELFSKLGSQRCICSPSTVSEKECVKNDKGKYIIKERIGKYSLITKNPSFNRLFENPITNLEESLLKQFIKHGFYFDEEAYKQAKHEMKNSKAIAKETIQEAIDEDGEINISNLNDKGKELIIQECVQIINKTKNNHYKVLIGLEGGLEYLGLNIGERKEILEHSLRITHPIDKEFKEHWNQIQSSLKSTKHKKGFGKNGLGKYKNLTSNIQNIKNYKNLYWSNVEKSNFNIFKYAYNEFLEIIHDYCLNRKTNYVDLQTRMKNTSEDETFYPTILEYLDEVLRCLGVEKYERMELMKDGSKLFYTNPNDCLSDYLRNQLHEKEDFFHGLDKKKFRTILNSLVSSLLTKEEKKETSIDYGELYEKWDVLESFTTILGITNTRPIKNLYLHPSNLKEDKRRKQASGFLRKKCGFKRTQTDKFIWDDHSRSYQQITIGGLGDYIKRSFGVSGIENDELKKIYDSSDEIVKEDDSICRTEDGFLHVLDGWEFEETTDLQKHFTLRTYPFHYKESLILKDLKEPTLYESTLKKILIPKNNEEDNSLFIDFLERLGSSLNTRNLYRKLTIYYGLGSNGKEMLITIIKAIFGKRCVEVNMEQVLNDDFRNLNHTDIWIFDELDEGDFDGLVAKLKNLTGGKDEGSTKRKMRTEEYFEEKYPSMVFCFTNIIPSVSLDQEAFFDRTDILTLPNTFVSEQKFNNSLNQNNLYVKNPHLKDELKKDELGKQWLFSKMCSTYKKGLDEQKSFEFTCSQTNEETKRFITNNDPMKTFLLETYEVDNTKTYRLKNNEICEEYKEWCMERKIVINEKNLSVQMGRCISNIFGDIKEKSNGTWYPLISKGEGELNLKSSDSQKKFKHNKKKSLYVINEDDEWILNKVHDLKDYKRKIYNFVKDYETNNGEGVPKDRISIQFENIVDVNKILGELVDERLLDVKIVRS